jgi:hypothetical protein
VIGPRLRDVTRNGPSRWQLVCTDTLGRVRVRIGGAATARVERD